MSEETTEKKSVPNRSKRFTPEQKKEIVDFILSTALTDPLGKLHPARGSFKEASIKFGCTPISARTFFKAYTKE